MSHPQFALFVSCVVDCLVTRYGTRTFIGAERQGNQIAYHPEQVVAIPHDEFRRYRREYLRALREGSLAERTADEWNEQNRQEPAPAEAHAERATTRTEMTPHDDPDRSRTVD